MAIKHSGINSMYVICLQDGWTALLLASDKGQLECVKELLNKGAQVDIHTMVSRACVTSFSDMVTLVKKAQ